MGLLLAVPVAATIWGSPYYLAATADKVRSPLHAWLRPSGLVGQAFGILGLALFLFMWLYPLRRRLGIVRGIGSMGAWLRVHTLIGIALPMLVGVHAGWRFTGIIGFGYAAMLVVSLSGFVGRYLYTRIPRSRSGLELSRHEIAERRRAHITEIAAGLELSPVDVERALERVARPSEATGLVSVVGRFFLDDVRRWRALSSLKREWRASARGTRADPNRVRAAVRLARDEIRLKQQLHALETTQRIFRYWHVAHRPVSITALLAVLVHVGVAIAMGQTWLH